MSLFKKYYDLIKNKNNEYYSESVLSDELKKKIEVEKAQDPEIKKIEKRKLIKFSYDQRIILYNITTETYMDKTGAAWTLSSFFQRAYYWYFFGNIDGYVAVRQINTMNNLKVYKLVSVSGSKKSIAGGLILLEKENAAIWGVVSSDIVDMSKTRGMITPPSWLVKLIFKLNIISSEDFGGAIIDSSNIEKDGGISIKYSGSIFKDSKGSMINVNSKKYFIANEKYYLWLNKELKDKYSIIINDDNFLKIIKNKINLLNALSIFKDIVINLNIRKLFEKGTNDEFI